MVALLRRPMRLVPESAMDRRMFPRTTCTGPVQTRRLDHSVAARRHPTLTMELRDVSVGGLCAISDMPLERGERLNVHFAGTALRQAWTAYGRVLRCDPCGAGYRVAVEFDPIPAAA